MQPPAEIPQKAAVRVGRIGRALAAVVRTVWDGGYRLSYVVGIQTLRYGRRAGRRLAKAWRPAGRVLARLADATVLRAARAVRAEGRRLAESVRLARRRVTAGFAGGVKAGLRALASLPGAAVRRHGRLAKGLLYVAAPAAALVMVVMTVQYWTGITFALSLEYEGETLGYIADASVYDAAAAMAAGRVINTDNSFTVERTPKMTLTVASQDDILDEAALCDRILQSSSDSIAQLVGLYVDGEFTGAVQDREELEDMLDSIRAAYCDEDATNERAEFVQEITMIPGLYPVSTMMGTAALKEDLTAVPAMATAAAAGEDADAPHAKLQVQVVRTISYTETVDYETETVDDSQYYIGYEAVRTAGKEGERLVTAEVRLLDGVEQSRTILSTEITSAPVNKVIVRGAKKVNPNVSAGDGVATGKFIWPLPSCKMISSDFGGRWGTMHKGIDISGNGVYGKEIIAADGGTVVEVNSSGYGGGYGLYVIIDHGGGYRTVYAHCSATLVSVGQKVSQGQLIALVGNTGNSYGAHLHFEIRVNGVPQDPKSYL